jgi:8-oxo-dGTP pyrophosphatase MutT (NUDIX family)
MSSTLFVSQHGTNELTSKSGDARIIQSKTVAAVFLLRDDGAALLQHRDDKPELRNANKWVPPGGAVEPGESLEAAAKREMFEETEYSCDQLFWLKTFDDHVDGWPPYSLTVFWGIYDGQQALHCHEGQELKFVKRELASEYGVPVQLILLWDQALAKYILA